jgi:hypothetical protein
MFKVSRLEDMQSSLVYCKFWQQDLIKLCMSYFHVLFADERKASGGSFSQCLSAVLAVELLVCPGEKDCEVQ